VSDSEAGGPSLLKRIGDAATSIQAIIALVLVLAAGVAWVASQFVDGDDDDPSVKPEAGIKVHGRSEQNRTLGEQLAREDNRTKLNDPDADRSINGDVHDVEVVFRGHEAPCRIIWSVHNANTNEELNAPSSIKPSEVCRTENAEFRQDIWVPNPDVREAEVYFVRFLLLDAQGTELDRAQSEDYLLG
jgi:hypothetical protein